MKTQSQILHRAQATIAQTKFQRLVLSGVVAVALLLALFSVASEVESSEVQFDAKLKAAAVAVDVGISEAQQFFPASFR